MTFNAPVLREKIAEEMALAGLPDTVQEELIAAMGQNILEAVSVAILMRMPQEGQEQFKKAEKFESAAEFDKMLRSYIPDLDAFVAAEAQKEIAAFKETFAQKLAEV